MTLKDSSFLSQGTSALSPLSGGGSGGSIQVITSVLNGNAEFSVKGGDGNDGGGGGSGGRIAVNFLGNYLSEVFEQITINWAGSMDLSGGTSQGGSGQNGTEWHPKCLAGYSGGFCDPCPIGTYKYGYSYGRCLFCENKPVNAFYTTKAVDTANCPYKCNLEYDAVSVNPDCLNQLDLQLQRLGNTYYALGLLGLFLGLTLIQWVCLAGNQGVRKRKAGMEKMKVMLKGDGGHFSKDDND